MFQWARDKHCVQIGSPGWVVWDETHFAGQASHYHTRSLYLDLHPPLGKLLIAGLGGVLGGVGTGPEVGVPGTDYQVIRRCFALFLFGPK